MILFIIIFLSIIYVIINFNNIKEYFDIAPSDGYFTLYNKSLMAELNKDNNNNGDKYNLDIIKKMDPDIFDIDFEKSNTLLQSKLKLLEQETDQTKIDNYKKDIRIIVNTYHNTQPKYASAAPDVRIRSSKGGLKRLPDIGTYDCAGAAGKQHIGGDKCKAGDTDKQCLTKCTKACDVATDPECLGIRFKRSEGQGTGKGPSCYLTKGIPTERKSLHALLPKDVNPEWCSNEQNKKQDKNKETFNEKCHDVNSQVYKKCPKTCIGDIDLMFDSPQCQQFSGLSTSELTYLCSDEFNKLVDKYNEATAAYKGAYNDDTANIQSGCIGESGSGGVVGIGGESTGEACCDPRTEHPCKSNMDDELVSSMEQEYKCNAHGTKETCNNAGSHSVLIFGTEPNCKWSEKVCGKDSKVVHGKYIAIHAKKQRAIINEAAKQMNGGKKINESKKILNNWGLIPCPEKCDASSENNCSECGGNTFAAAQRGGAAMQSKAIPVPYFNESCKKTCMAKNMSVGVRVSPILGDLNMKEMWEKVLPDGSNEQAKSDYCRAKHKEYCDPNQKIVKQN
jgi:hypothetical protein